MPSAASFARSIGARQRIDLETCAPGSSHGPPPSFDLPQTCSFHLCGRSASGRQSASEAIGEAPERWRGVSAFFRRVWAEFLLIPPELLRTLWSKPYQSVRYSNGS